MPILGVTGAEVRVTWVGESTDWMKRLSAEAPVKVSTWPAAMPGLMAALNVTVAPALVAQQAPGSTTSRSASAAICWLSM